VIGLRLSLLPLWAAREILRRPAEGLLVCATLFLLTLSAATPLLLTQALDAAASRMLDQAPAIVVRRTGPAGWMPLPIEEATSEALSVPGVTAAEPRIWARAAGPNGLLTVVGFGSRSWKQLQGFIPGPVPEPGRCIAGPDVVSHESAPLRIRNGRQTLTLEPVAHRGRDTGTLPPGFVLANEADARHLLQIPAGFATDLALDVFHEQEQGAILEELESAFPWPVEMTTRSGVKGAYAAALSRDGALWLIALAPAILAMILIVLATGKAHAGLKREFGLLRAVGWTPRDLVTLHALKGLYLAAPAVALGLFGACLLVFWPDIRWPDRLLWLWAGPAQPFYLDPAGIGLTLLQVAVFILCPYLAAVIWPSASRATADPLEVLRAGE
jgi:hypothetical protein